MPRQKIPADDERWIEYEEENLAIFKGTKEENSIREQMGKKEYEEFLVGMLMDDKRSLHNFMLKLRTDQKKKGIHGITKNVTKDSLVKNAQGMFGKFAKEHAEKILDKKKRRKWTKFEIKLLKRMTKAKKPKWKEIAKIMKRSYGSVYGKWYRSLR